MIKAIMACDSQGGVGKNGALPWPHNRKDLSHFKRLTVGHTVVMGSKTWDSNMPTPLPLRRNMVATRNPNFEAPGAELLLGDLTQGLTTLSQSSNVYLIGGANLLHELIDEIIILHLTRITGSYDCDTFINLDEIQLKFEMIDRVEVDTMTTFETYFARKLNDLSFDTKF
jgi:dihydrofolate reductase